MDAKKFSSLFLVIIMVLSVIPVMGTAVFATDGDKGTSGDFKYSVISEKEKTCEITKYTGSATVLTIPSELDSYTVIAIGIEAFENCTALTSVTVPNGVINIDGEAFEGCTALTSVTIPDSVTGILWNAFYNCTSLESIIIPDGVTHIGDFAFANCSSLKNITIPDSVTNISAMAFDNTSYYNDESKWENDVLYIGKYLIKAKENISGEYKIKDGTICIASDAFENCERSLKSVTLPNSIITIGISSFADCTSLTNVTIPENVTHIGDKAFYGCTSLESITIPDSVKYICSKAFENCTSLKNIFIGNGATKIFSCVFLNTAYYNNESNWENGVLYIGNYLIKSKEDIVSGEYKIKDGTVGIADNAFYGCTSLESITIPDSVTDIGDFAFYGCNSLAIYSKSGSYAETFANENGIPFNSIDNVKNDKKADEASRKKNTVVYIIVAVIVVFALLSATGVVISKRKKKSSEN